MTFPLLQDATFTAVAMATLLPVVAFGVIMLFTRTFPTVSAGISLAVSAASLVCAVYLLARHRHLVTPLRYTTQWLISGGMVIPFGFLLDAASLLMLTIVASISFLVQVYSLGYMAGDPGFSRYYAFLSLFAWAMLSLTVSPTLLQLYVFWELVGLSSYLLIGFWHEKFSASEAGKKAFVMTRFGDIAFFIGLLLVLFHLGNLNILEVNSPDIVRHISPGLITLSAVLIFGGIIGKSAQFPLLTWLPDAMEGPTPVSALLHSATMVAAGVFLFARLFPFFSLSPTAMTFFLVIGTISMLLSSTMAMVSRDIKQVWAFSTISQLGFMIMGLAAGGYVAGIFHLTTHAGFKALLFLCAGAFIHSHGTNDMKEIGEKGGRRLKVPMICMTLAAAALSGFPPLSGFFSKELIMGRLAALENPVWLAAGLMGAFLTAYYAFRLIFIILFPQKGDPDPTAAAPHAHHTGNLEWVMHAPLLLLAAVTVVLGFFEEPVAHFLAPSPGPASAVQGTGHGWLPFLAVGLAVAGVGLAWVEFGRRDAERKGFIERIPALHELFARRWYLDRFYRRFLDVIIYKGVSRLFSRNDRKVIDGGIDSMGKGVVRVGRGLSILHTGMIQYRLLAMFAVVVLLALSLFL